VGQRLADFDAQVLGNEVPERDRPWCLEQERAKVGP
jgi:hypothetical protein